MYKKGVWFHLLDKWQNSSTVIFCSLSGTEVWRSFHFHHESDRGDFGICPLERVNSMVCSIPLWLPWWLLDKTRRTWCKLAVKWCSPINFKYQWVLRNETEDWIQSRHKHLQSWGHAKHNIWAFFQCLLDNSNYFYKKNSLFSLKCHFLKC